MSENAEPHSRENDVIASLEAIKPFVVEFGQGAIEEHGFFSMCLRSSFVKSFEFCEVAWGKKCDDEMFFLLPSLRGICEELIYFNSVQGYPREDKEELFASMMGRELHAKTKAQASFFAEWREFQPVLKPPSDDGAAALDERIRKVWRKHGWPNLEKKVMPSTRELAAKGGEHVLAVLYDYFYDITSGMVHCRVQSLLRMGWGKLPHCEFSTRNFSDYYKAFAAIYGAFLFCLYFELLEHGVNAPPSVLAHVAIIRQYILEHPRWPEMVTPEELNLPTKKVLPIFQVALTAMSAQGRDRLIPRAGETVRHLFGTKDATD